MPVAVYIVWTPCLHYVHNGRLLVSHLLPRISFVVPRSPFLQGINADSLCKCNVYQLAI